MKKKSLIRDLKQVNQMPKGYSDKEKIEQTSKSNQLY